MKLVPQRIPLAILVVLLFGCSGLSGPGPSVYESKTSTEKEYYAYPAYEDEYGVIAPWYDGQNGQCDERVRSAVETIKRYPWATADQAVRPAPHFLYDGAWSIDRDGEITVLLEEAQSPDEYKLKKAWSNGDLVARAARLIFAMQEYYAYSGDPYAMGIITMTADHIIDHCQTAKDHAWPEFPISAPVRGDLYGDCNPKGYIQLDNSAGMGVALLRAYKMTGDPRYFDTARRWGMTFAEKCDHSPGNPPWPRYVNPEDVRWGMTENGNRMTGGVSYVLTFLDELANTPGVEDRETLLRAIDSGERYLRDSLIPNWSENPTWGYNYWDTKGGFSNHNVVYWTSRYIFAHKDRFPGWEGIIRRIITIMLHRTSPNPKGENGVYSGAWVHTESFACCGDTNGYGPQRTAGLFLQFADETGSEWGKEVGRRMAILSSYDALESGMIIDGLVSHKAIVAKNWFKIAVPNPIVFFIRNMSWLPESLAPNRENHLLRAASPVQNIVYGDGWIEYETFDAPVGGIDVLRLAFVPTSVQVDSVPLRHRDELDGVGYTVRRLPGGDAVVSIRRDGATHVAITGKDPQGTILASKGQFNGQWEVSDTGARSSEKRATCRFVFTGNQVRLVGNASWEGGRAVVYLDGEKQRDPIDFWSPVEKVKQTMFSRSGLENGMHSLEIEVQGESNPYSGGRVVSIDSLQFSSATGISGFGSGGGPVEAQRFILGYPDARDYIDRNGNAWTSATEVLVPKRPHADAVALHWYQAPEGVSIEGTRDEELYLYGMHAESLTVYFTVGPGEYDLRLRLAETRPNPDERGTMNITINGEKLPSAIDVAKAAGGVNRAYDVVIKNVEPRNGVIEVVFTGNGGKEALAQAVEIAPSETQE